jgi:hypothetical protein
MARKVRQHPFGDPPAGVEHQYSMRINNRIVERDTPLRLKGRRGEWRFIRHVVKSDSAWIDVFSPDGQWYSVHTDAVKTVRSMRKGRPR